MFRPQINRDTQLTLIAIVLGGLFAVTLIFAIAMMLTACTSAERSATVDHPLTGCIMPTLAERGSREGKLLPEPVRVVGTTSPEDGERWKVLRGPNFDPNKWEPHAREEVKFGAICGPEVSALDQMFQASHGDGAAAGRTIPPR